MLKRSFIWHFPEPLQDLTIVLKLTGSLTFDDIAIAQVGADTEIRETVTNETLATLIGIDAGTIDSSDFV